MPQAVIISGLVQIHEMMNKFLVPTKNLSGSLLKNLKILCSVLYINQLYTWIIIDFSSSYLNIQYWVVILF